MDFSENELISEIKQRNNNAYEILIREYTKPIYYLAYNILNGVCGKEDIEECISDVLLEIWLKIDSFDGEKGNFKTWVFMLTKYKALKYRAKNSKHKVVNIDEQVIESSFSIEKIVVDKEKQNKLIATIEAFNTVDKELFIRRYFYGEEINDLMDSLQLSRSAIDNRLLRGRKIIKEALSHE